MARQSAFDIQQIQQSSHDDGNGLLEHLNLPPAVIRFIKKNKKNLQIAVIAVVAVVVCWTLYSSYRSNRIQKGSAALAIAMQAPEAQRHEALLAVTTDFSGTPSAQWASTELAHAQMKAGKYKEAAEQYEAVRKKVSQSNPLFALLTFGLAQAHEAAKVFETAIAEYQSLQKIQGYEREGVAGLGRIYEFQGEIKKALDVYESYQATFTGDNLGDPAKAEVDEKIARLKAMQ